MPAWMTSLLREEVSVPIPSAASRMITSRPACARARATARPTTPAPTTTQSTSSTPWTSLRKLGTAPFRKSFRRRAAGLSLRRNRSPYMLTLRAGSNAIVVAPESGAGVVGWPHGGTAMLRRAVPGAMVAGDPNVMGWFPLVPYANRIAGGRFVWLGQEHRLAPNFGDSAN